MSDYTNAHLNGMLRQRWRERNLRGVWFYGTWLFHRYYGASITMALVGIPAGVWLFMTVRSA